MAEREGFEPSVDCSTAVFKTAALNHSTISPLCQVILPFKSEISSFFIRICLLFRKNRGICLSKNGAMMSLEAVQIFYQKLETDPELRQRALGLQKRFKDQEQVIDAFIALAAEQGHSFTAAELVQYILIHGKADS